MLVEETGDKWSHARKDVGRNGCALDGNFVFAKKFFSGLGSEEKIRGDEDETKGESRERKSIL